MSLFGETHARERLWLAETTAAALDVVSRCPDVDEVLRFWAREIAKELERVRVALFVIEGERWLRILPENQAGEVPFVTEATLSRALNAPEPMHIDSLAPGDPDAVLVRYAARASWRGVLVVWMDRDRLSAAQIRQACDVANAVGHCLTVLKKSEMSREQAIAQERSRWAAELHDGHLQMLSSAKLQADVCVSLEREHEKACPIREASPVPPLRTELERLHDLMADTVREARQFLLELRSPPVTADQFLPWLRAYAEDFSRENGIRVEMRIEGEGELPQSHVEEATRLVREALTNVRKHARAGEVRIVVVFSDRNASISVSDDGVGFDVRDTMERLLDSSHNGLIGIRYRAESVGGEMRLRSEVGKGTTLLFRLPRTTRTGGLEGVGRRRATREPSSPFPPAAAASRDTSVRDSIRATLAEAIDSFLEQQADERAARPQGRE